MNRSGVKPIVCPECGSYMTYYRIRFSNWVCRHCGFEFSKPGYVEKPADLEAAVLPEGFIEGDSTL